MSQYSLDEAWEIWSTHAYDDRAEDVELPTEYDIFKAGWELAEEELKSIINNEIERIKRICDH